MYKWICESVNSHSQPKNIYRLKHCKHQVYKRRAKSNFTLKVSECTFTRWKWPSIFFIQIVVYVVRFNLDFNQVLSFQKSKNKYEVMCNTLQLKLQQ